MYVHVNTLFRVNVQLWFEPLFAQASGLIDSRGNTCSVRAVPLLSPVFLCPSLFCQTQDRDHADHDRYATAVVSIPQVQLNLTKSIGIRTDGFLDLPSDLRRWGWDWLGLTNACKVKTCLSHRSALKEHEWSF